MIVDRGGITAEPRAYSPKAFSTASMASFMVSISAISSSDMYNIAVAEEMGGFWIKNLGVWVREKLGSAHYGVYYKSLYLVKPHY